MRHRNTIPTHITEQRHGTLTLLGSYTREEKRRPQDRSIRGHFPYSADRLVELAWQ